MSDIPEQRCGSIKSCFKRPKSVQNPRVKGGVCLWPPVVFLPPETRVDTLKAASKHGTDSSHPRTDMAIRSRLDFDSTSTIL